MATPEMSDEELDALARRGAESFQEEVPPPLGAWARMDDKLQAAALRRLVRGKVARLFAAEAAIVVLALLGWQGYQEWAPGSATEFADNSVVPAPNQPTLPNPAPALTIPEAAVPESGIAAVESPDTEAQRSSVAASSGSADAGAETERMQVAKSAPVVASVSRRRGSASSALRNEQPQVANQLPTAAPIAPSSSATATESGAGSVAETPKTSVQSAVKVDSAAQALSAATPVEPPQEAPTEQETAPFYRWTIGLIGGPSVSAVRSSGARVGGDIGLTMEYRFLPRLRARIGLVRSVKRYAAESSDYTWPAGTTFARGPVIGIDANCRITEIPINLRYDLLVQPAYTVFVSTGLTSLLMRNERYGYWYNDPNNVPYMVSRSVEKGSNHRLSVVNVSAGVERNVGGRWSVQAEPFVAVPLGGVGRGKLKLQSAGAAFSVKYGLFGRKSPK